MRGSGGRDYLSLTSGVVVDSDDSNPVQTVSVRGMANELVRAQRFTGYGHHSVLPTADNNGANGAEAVVAFMHGNRSHPIVVADVDRRTKPKNWSQGQSGLWHYKGATAKFTDDGWMKDAGSDKKPSTETVGNCTVTWADGKATVDVDGTQFIVKGGKICLGDESASIPVMLQTGPSSLVFATR